MMANARRPIAFWIIVSFLAISILLMLIGQTMAVFNYDLAVRLGLQESPGQVSEFGVQERAWPVNLQTPFTHCLT